MFKHLAKDQSSARQSNTKAWREAGKKTSVNLLVKGSVTEVQGRSEVRVWLIIQSRIWQPKVSLARHRKWIKEFRNDQWIGEKKVRLAYHSWATEANEVDVTNF